MTVPLREWQAKDVRRFLAEAGLPDAAEATGDDAGRPETPSVSASVLVVALLELSSGSQERREAVKRQCEELLGAPDPDEPPRGQATDLDRLMAR